MLKLLGKENVRKEEFIHAALVPRADGQGPAVRLPSVWDFEGPEGYFRGVIVQRLHVRAMRVWWDQTHKVHPQDQTRRDDRRLGWAPAGGTRVGNPPGDPRSRQRPISCRE